MVEISTFGAIFGLAFAVFLIFKKLNPVYSMIGGALVGGLAGGASLTKTVDILIGGAESIVPAVVRVLCAGIFAGVIIETGAANKIADRIIKRLGEDFAMLAIILSAMIICAVGVLLPVSVITIAPIALVLGEKANFSKASVLIAVLGGAKSGNMLSPNPNTIAIADGFKVDLSMVMIHGLLPAISGVIATYFIAKILIKKGDKIVLKHKKNEEKLLPSFRASILGPVVVVGLLVLSSVLKLGLDSMLILPIGGFISALAMKRTNKFLDYCTEGLNKMTGPAILLLGTGTLAGVISKSALSASIIGVLNNLGIPGIFLASIAGILMGGASASVTGGSVITSTVFSKPILALGVKPIAAAEMVHTGVSVIDDLPHGNLFHISAQSVDYDIAERMKLIPYELLIGLTMNIVATILYGFVLN
ncbi:gluconate:H+ symporter, GntP family [Clostridium cavendishii DSM 21758]|uniref:Gluconate:H+ symporter, GntP family n=1 Tax=Clostridium cavendishii DSM 21758 TaxID=1121302 RepID=A0A1M6SZJ4_9CLOT|nr:Na+/H+ antiporter NhaC family protein [Clostridium cavendishii]SHK49968.1 gluconate:H+ symporter, GntP family [Clostridium cavendishii DSM 21758]